MKLQVQSRGVARLAHRIGADSRWAHNNDAKRAFKRPTHRIASCFFRHAETDDDWQSSALAQERFKPAPGAVVTPAKLSESAVQLAIERTMVVQ